MSADIHVRVGPSLREQLEELAAADRRTVAFVVREAAEEFVARRAAERGSGQ